MFDDIPIILAQEELSPAAPPSQSQATEGQPSDPSGGVNGAPPPARPQGLFNNPMLLMLIIALPLMFILMGGGQRKEKKRREAMLAALKKGDKVQTIGGIMGTAIEVKENSVVVKVDEKSNTRMEFARTAIQNVVEEQ